MYQVASRGLHCGWLCPLQECSLKTNEHKKWNWKESLLDAFRSTFYILNIQILTLHLYWQNIFVIFISQNCHSTKKVHTSAEHLAKVQEMNKDFKWSHFQTIFFVPCSLPAVSAHPLCENMQRYKMFDSVNSIKSYVKRNARLATCSLTNKMKAKMKENCSVWHKSLWK